MKHTFATARIALLEARMSSEIANMIQRYGGTAYSVPAMREVPLDCRDEVATFIDHLTQSKLSTMVFLTGVGCEALLHTSAQLGRLSEVLDILRSITVVCRGPKPVAALKHRNIPISLVAKEPYTTKELLEVMQPLPLQDQGVALVHYGERNAYLAQTLRERGALLEELCLYEWQLPTDTTPLQTLVQEIIASRMDAVVFTSQVQVRHLFQVAANSVTPETLAHALNTQTIVASIGPTCTATLHDFGVTPHVVPEHPKMGFLIKELAAYMG